MGRFFRVVMSPGLWLIIYLLGLAFVAFSPVRIDSEAGALIRQITAEYPALTHSRIEFFANVLLFVPFGYFVTLILRQGYLALPIAVVCAVAIELTQDMFLAARVGSMRDVVANVAGACVGIVLAAIWQSIHRGWLRHRRQRRDVSRRAPDDRPLPVSVS